MTNCDSERGRPARRCRDYRKSGYATELHHHSMSDAQLRELLDTTVAGGFDVDEDLLRQPSRGVARIALARQVAMYLAHVACGLSKAETGRLFGRDRTTVHHACIVIEQRRDDRSFDHAIDHLERVVKIVAGTRRTACAN
jgi:chromosomal replication initiation ATPase DnaA